MFKIFIRWGGGGGISSDIWSENEISERISGDITPINAILKGCIMGNIHVKFYGIWTSCSGGDVV